MENAHVSRGDCGPLLSLWVQGERESWLLEEEGLRGAAQFQASVPVLALLKATSKFPGRCGKGMRRWTFSSDGPCLTGEEAWEPCW